MGKYMTAPKGKMPKMSTKKMKKKHQAMAVEGH